MQKTSRGRTTSVAVLLLIAVFALWFWQRPHEKKETDHPAAAEAKVLQLSEDEARRAGLVVKPLEATNTGEVIELFGAVEANKDRLARVVAPVAGRLVNVPASLGDAVETGATLAILESPESGEAQAAAAQAEAELALASRNLERIRGLVAGGSLARKEETKAQAEFAKARAARDAALAKRRRSVSVRTAGPAG